MTAHAMRGDRERSLDAGMNDHLTKPISPAILSTMLSRWMPAKLVNPPAPGVPR
jgi:CheY-like chemotaxis protein